MDSDAKVIIFLGPPGAGKGTQAAQLSTTLGIPAISTGEMLRRECQSGSALGKAVQSVLASGQLVSDDLINRVVANRLLQLDCELGCILDGYPRTIAQARYLGALLEKLNVAAPVIFDFDISLEDVVFRLSCRRQCPECGRVYSAKGDSDADIFCDQDGSRVVQRVDDHPATIRERLRLYKKNAAEMIRYYQTSGYYLIQATLTPSEIFDKLMNLLASIISAPGSVSGRALSRLPPISPARLIRDTAGDDRVSAAMSA